MSDAVEYKDIFLVTRGALTNGRIKLHKQGVIFKSTKTGKVEQIPMADIESVYWMRVARGYGLKVTLNTLTEFKFVGFREADYDKLSEYISKNFSLKLEEIELSVKGWNWGVAKFKGSILSFEVDKKPSFEIPLKDVSAATTGKNEVTVEFHQHDDAQVSLMEMRFYVPLSTGDVDDPLKDFHEQILAKADVIQATGDAIVTFPEVACLTPRGRYSIKVYPHFIQLHGKTYDYKIPHTTILRLFLLPHKDQRFMFFVVSMDPPIRQGQTRYPFLILQFEREEEITCKLNVSDDDIKTKYNGKLQQDMSGPVFEVVSRVLKEVVGRKITVPGSFKGHSGNSITCSHRAGNGLLYPLERGFIFVHKPPVHVRSDEISCVNFARGGSTGRTFDFDVELKNGTVVNFSNLDRDEYGHLFDFVTSKNLRIRNKGGKASQPSMMDDLMDSDDDEHDVYLNRVKDEARQRDDDDEDDDSEEDSDFNPENDKNDDEDNDVKEEFDSNASESESGSEDEEGGEGGEGSPEKKPEKKRKAESKPKSSAPKRSKKDPSERKKKKVKDKNAPKRATTAYMLWLSDTRETIKKDNPGISMIDIAKKGGELWRELTDKTKWEDLAKKDKERYEKEMEEYKKRPKDLDDEEPEAPSHSSKKSKTVKETAPKKSKSSSTSTKVSPGKFKSKEFIDSSDSSSGDEEKPSSSKIKKEKSKGKDKSKAKDKSKTKEKSKAKEDKSSGEESEAKMTDASGEESAGAGSADEGSAGEKSADEGSAGEKSADEGSAGEKSAGEGSAGEESD